MKKSDICVVGLMYAVCALFLSMTFGLKKEAQTYPLFIIALLFILTSIYVVQMIIAAKKEGVSSGFNEIFEGFQKKQFFTVLGMIFAYLIIMYFAGFYIATVLIMVSCLLFLKVPKWQIALATLAILGLVYGAFTLFLGVNLPAGLLFK